MAEIVITIDGPAASGKSTMAQRLADRLGATFLDTGAMYRAVTLAAVRDGVDLADERQLVRVIEGHRFDFDPGGARMHARIDGEDVTDLLRGADLTATVRHLAAAPRVRERLVEMQRAFAARYDKVVTEGRDQGTVVFPDARVKIYLTADAAERARRRVAELQAKGEQADLEQMREAIESRDRSDESRAVGPLKPAADAVTVDTTGLSIEQAVERLYGVVAPRAAVPDRRRTTNDASHVTRRALPVLKAAWYRVAQIGCRISCAIVFRFCAYGTKHVPEQGGFLLASNHQCYLDPVFCGLALRRRLSFVARDSLFRFKLFSWLIYSLNAIPIGRGRADVTAMKTIIARLQSGGGVCLYPEATRTRDGRISPFKPGFGLLCRRAKVAVVPTLIDGAFECWPRHRMLFAAGRITVWYGKPLTPEQIKGMTNKQLADHLTSTLRHMQHDFRLQQGKEPYDYED